MSCRATSPALAGLALSALLAPGVAQASGFHVDEQDARATGRAGAVIASSTNASAVYYNSAGIAQLQGLRIDVGGSLVAPSAEFTSAVDGRNTGADTQLFVLPQLFVAWRASDIAAFGIGAYSPFGLALKWPASSPGRTNIREADLRTLFVTPTLALNLSRWFPGFAIGGGIDLVPSSVRLTRDIPFGADTARVAVGGDAFGYGGRVGIDYRPLPMLSIGISYRSPVDLKFDGDADFDAAPAYRASLPPDGAVETEVTLPQMLTLGVEVAPIPELKIELDGSWRGWSSYDRLDVLLPDGSIDSDVKDWNDSYTLRLGGEYSFQQRYAVRAGVIWDQAPVPADQLDFQVPDANRIDLSLGFGAHFAERFNVDFGALWVLPQQRSTAMSDPLEPPVKGRFDIDVWVFQLTLGVDLDPTGPAAPGTTADSALGAECGHQPELVAQPVCR